MNMNTLVCLGTGEEQLSCWIVSYQLSSVCALVSN